MKVGVSMAINPIARVSVDMIMDNGAMINLAEGDIVRGLKYRSSGKTLKVDGAVRVINAVTKVKNSNVVNCIHEPYLHDYITVQSIVLDSSNEFDAELNTIQISSIISIESVEKDAGVISVGTGSQYKALEQVIAEAPAGSTIKLISGKYDAPMTLDKDIKIIGDGTVELTGAITVGNATSEDAPKIHIEGVSLSGDAVININEVSEFTLKGCTIKSFDLTKSTQPVHFTKAVPVLVTIEDNTFEAQNEFSYNLINNYAKWMDGSSVSRNIFKRGCCTHNHISIFDVEEGATITIADNICERSDNMVHVQIMGEPKCTIIMENNTYLDSNPEYPEWRGLFLIQPNSTKTTTYEHTIIHCNNTTMPNGHTQLAYRYMHENNTQLTEEQWPTVYIDGIKTTLPLYGVEVPDETNPESETVQ